MNYDPFLNAVDALPNHLRAAAYLSGIDPVPLLEQVDAELRRLEELLDEVKVRTWWCADCGRIYSEYTEPEHCDMDEQYYLCKGCVEKGHRR